MKRIWDIQGKILQRLKMTGILMSILLTRARYIKQHTNRDMDAGIDARQEQSKLVIQKKGFPTPMSSHSDATMKMRSCFVITTPVLSHHCQCELRVSAFTCAHSKLQGSCTQRGDIQLVPSVFREKTQLKVQSFTMEGDGEMLGRKLKNNEHWAFSCPSHCHKWDCTKNNTPTGCRGLMPTKNKRTIHAIMTKQRVPRGGGKVRGSL